MPLTRRSSLVQAPLAEAGTRPRRSTKRAAAPAKVAPTKVAPAKAPLSKAQATARANAALLNYPTSVVVKMSGELEFKRFLAEGLGAYAKEKFAYASLPRELLSVRVPRVYGCFSDPGSLKPFF